MRAGRFMNRRTAVFGLFTAAYFLSYFFRSANAVIAPDLSRDLHLGARELGLMTSLFYAAFAAVQVPLGAALDRFGPRVVTPGFMLVTAVGAVVFATSHSFAQVALGRALIGMGMAGVFMGSLKVFSQWFSLRRFARVSGYLVGLGAMGALAAGTPLALVVQAMGWRSVFALGAALVVLSSLSIFLWTRNAPVGVEWRSNDETRGSVLQVFRDARFWRIAALDFFLVGTLLSMQGLWGGPFLYDVFGLSQVRTGNLLILLSLGAIAGYVSCGSFAERFGTPRTLTWTSSAFVAAQVVMISAALLGHLWMVWIAYPVFGFAGAFNVLLMAHSRSVFPTSMTGRAVTALNLFGIGGSAVIQWGMGMVIGSFGRDSADHYPPMAYAVALGITAVGGALSLLWYRSLAHRSG
ncbi:MAG TPA: MFS transporter [Thermoleophilia bacterium]|nr:MFS transporter [Thermoleophilia bacterium]